MGQTFSRLIDCTGFYTVSTIFQPFNCRKIPFMYVTNFYNFSTFSRNQNSVGHGFEFCLYLASFTFCLFGQNLCMQFGIMLEISKISKTISVIRFFGILLQHCKHYYVSHTTLIHILPHVPFHLKTYYPIQILPHVPYHTKEPTTL